MSQQKATIFGLIGAPTSGKSQHAQRLIRDFNLKHINLPEYIFNQIKKQPFINSKTQLGDKMCKFVQSGKLIPFVLINQIISEQIDVQSADRYLIEGFPRNIPQIQNLSSDYNIQLDKIIHIQLSQSLIQQNLSSRLKSSQRIDNTQQANKQKIEIYINQIRPTMAHLNKFGCVINVSAEGNQLRTYEEIQRGILPTVVFLYGPPCLGKSQICKQLQLYSGFKYICLESFFKTNQNPVQNINNFIDYLIKCKQKNILIDDMFSTSDQVKIFLKKFGEPFKVYYLQSTKDQVDANLLKYIQNPKQRQLFIDKYDNFVQNRTSICKLLQPLKSFVQINSNLPLPQIKYNFLIRSSIIKDYRPKLLLTYINQCQEQALQFLDKLQQDFGYLHLNIEDQCYFQKNMRSDLGSAIDSFLSSGEKVPEELQLQIIKRRIFANLHTPYFTISTFPNIINQIQSFEQLIGQPDFFINFFINSKPLSYSRKTTGMIKYMQKGNLITINQNNPQVLVDIIADMPCYGLIIGPTASGKTTLLKQLNIKTNIVQWQPSIITIKQKLSTPQQPIQQVPYKQIIKYFNTLLHKNKQAMYIFDGFPYDHKQWNQWTNANGYPEYLINLDIEKSQLIKRYKKKNQIEANAELSQEDQAKIDGIITKHADNLQFYKQQIQNYSKSKFLNMNANLSIDKTVASLSENFKSNIYIFQNCNSIQLQQLAKNVCIRNGFAYIDVPNLIKLHFQNNLSEKKSIISEYQMSWSNKSPNDPQNYTPQLVMKIINEYLSKMIIKKRDIFLINYSLSNSNYPRISHQINAIERYLGRIRYLIGKYDRQPDYNFENQKLQLQRPEVEKPVLKEGYIYQLGQQPPPQQQKKAVFDIYDYEWSKVGIKKGLATWLMKYHQTNVHILQKQGVIQLFDIINEHIVQIKQSSQLCLLAILK